MFGTTSLIDEKFSFAHCINCTFVSLILSQVKFSLSSSYHFLPDIGSISTLFYKPDSKNLTIYDKSVFIGISDIFIITPSHVTIVSYILQSSRLSSIVRKTHAFYAKLKLMRFVSSHSCISS